MQISMLQLIEDFTAALKSEEVYLHYVACKKQLEKEPLKSLLEKLSEKKNLYYELLPYEKYQDLSSLKKEILLLASEVESNEAYQAYFQAKNKLDERIIALNAIIFGSLDLDIGGEKHACNCR